MATAGDCGGAGEKFRKRSFVPDLNEEPENDLEAVQNNSSEVSELSTHQHGNSATIGISESEQMLKQKTDSRSETQHLISLLHSRTSDNDVFERDGAKPPPFSSPSLTLSLEPSTTTGSLKKCKHGDERNNFHAAVFRSRELEEEIVSPAKLTKAYKDSTIGTGQGSRQDPTTMENLPDNVLTKIFIRFLAKQLAQMRSVSKSWNAFLSQPSFVKSHLHHSIHNNDHLLLHFPSDEPSTPLRSLPPHLKLTTFIKFPPITPQSEYTRFRIIGSVNGLICSSFGDSVIHIWNPSLSAVSTLPPSSMPSSDGNMTRIYLRFGFDPKADDYKVIKLTGLSGNIRYPSQSHFINEWLQVEVYSMRKGSWEFITQRFPWRVRRILDDDIVCSDGHVHWRTCIGGDSDTIVSFNLGSETFRVIPLPHPTYGRSKSLRVLGRKHRVILMDVFEVVMDEYEVVMDEYGVAESWVMNSHVFSQFIDDTYPVGFTLHDEFLNKNTYNRQAFYDPITNEVKILENDCSYGECGKGKTVEYVHSLIWVAPIKREMVDDAEQN